jgi:hypothetical protein
VIQHAKLGTPSGSDMSLPRRRLVLQTRFWMVLHELTKFMDLFVRFYEFLGR